MTDLQPLTNYLKDIGRPDLAEYIEENNVQERESESS